MKRLTKIILIVVAGSGLVFGATAFAKRGHGDHGNRMIERVSERLELDEGQVAALQALKVEIEETRDVVRGNDTDMRTQVMALITADTFDQNAALGMITERTQALENNAPDLVAAAAVFLDGLSAEQKAEAESLMNRFGGRHGRHGHGNGEGN